jgi:glycine/serine hydroxymethyltransferase
LPACYKIDETYIASRYNTTQELNLKEVCVSFQASHQRNKQSKPSIMVFGASHYVTPTIVELIDEFLERNAKVVTFC